MGDRRRNGLVGRNRAAIFGGGGGGGRAVPPVAKRPQTLGPPAGGGSRTAEQLEPTLRHARLLHGPRLNYSQAHGGERRRSVGPRDAAGRYPPWGPRHPPPTATHQTTATNSRASRRGFLFYPAVRRPPTTRPPITAAPPGGGGKRGRAGSWREYTDCDRREASRISRTPWGWAAAQRLAGLHGQPTSPRWWARGGGSRTRPWLHLVGFVVEALGRNPSQLGVV